MARPTLSSFVNPSQYNSETISVNPLIAGFYGGGTASTPYTAPTFNGASGAASNDPGGLFGWLIYARANISTVKGATSDAYIEYTNPGSFVNDLNLLNGITYCLISKSSEGGTYGLFQYTNNTVLPRSAGTDFLHAINYLAYGGTLVITGSSAGFDTYENNTGKAIDVLIGTTANASLTTWLFGKQYTVGIFPTRADSVNSVGNGYTMANFDSYLGSAYDQVAAGSTFSTRVFNVYGLKTLPPYDTSSLLPSSTLSKAVILPATSDVAGFFARAKGKNNIYVSVAGIDMSYVLNGTIANSVEWSNASLKTILKNNRVNFFINYSPTFLGQDLVGATANSSAVVSSERIGSSEIRTNIQKDVTNITLKYLYLLNNASTRSSLTTEVANYLAKYNQYLDTTYTQIICDSSNNTDNLPTLNVDLIVKPLLSTDTIVINTSLTA